MSAAEEEFCNASWCITDRRAAQSARSVVGWVETQHVFDHPKILAGHRPGGDFGAGYEDKVREAFRQLGVDVVEERICHLHYGKP
jgi:hypothetical protein